MNNLQSNASGNEINNLDSSKANETDCKIVVNNGKRICASKELNQNENEEEENENNDNISQPVKRIKLEPAEQTSNDEKLPSYQNKIDYSKEEMLHYFNREYSKKRESYVDHLLELFFIEQQGNLMDYYTWRKKIPTVGLLQYFRTVANDLDQEYEELQYIKASLDYAIPSTIKIVPLSQLRVSSDNTSNITASTINSSASTPNPATSLSTNNAHNVTVCSSVTTPSAAVKTTVNNQSLKNVINSFTIPSPTSKSALISSSSQPVRTSLQTPVGNNKQISKTQGISSVYESSIGSQEQIVERAKQEAHVMQRVAELRKEGLWSAKRLPRIQEPPREKAHWDYLLEEMRWLATDFAQERKWKKIAAKKCARMIMKYHLDKKMQVEKAEKDE